MAINTINSSNRATDRNTPIVKPGNEFDKNAFLRILTTELSNQDPENAKDSTEYVAQMAQFAALEQMSNLNGTMSFAGASSLIGKTITLNDVDTLGNQYWGIVKSVSKDGSNIKLNVMMEDNGEIVIKEFDYSDVTEVENS